MCNVGRCARSHHSHLPARPTPERSGRILPEICPGPSERVLTQVVPTLRGVPLASGVSGSAVNSGVERLRIVSRVKVISVCQPSVRMRASSTVGSSSFGEVTVRASTFMSSSMHLCQRRAQPMLVVHTGKMSCVVPRNAIRCQSLNHSASATRCDRSPPCELSLMSGACSSASFRRTFSICWSSKPGRFSMGYDAEWNTGDGFCGKPFDTCGQL